MIKTLEVKNFKSIKHLRLDCKRINIFIGKPNTGKSNILESIGIFSYPYNDLKSFIRFENMTNLFYDQDLEKKIEIRADGIHCVIIFEKDKFEGKAGDNERRLVNFNFSYNFEGHGSSGHSKADNPFKFYRFNTINTFQKYDHNFLHPPNGENLLSILLINKPLRKMVSEIFSGSGFRVVLRPQENKIEIQKEVDDIVISFPYSLVSDTLQRVVFYLAAIETNRESVIIFEEPEAHAFPYYVKFLAERMAMDKTNQYFIATHNPYILSPILEKAPKEEIGIFITYFEDYQTKVRAIKEEEMPEILDLDTNIFFNLDKFLELK